MPLERNPDTLPSFELKRAEQNQYQVVQGDALLPHVHLVPQQPQQQDQDVNINGMDFVLMRNQL